MLVAIIALGGAYAIGRNSDPDSPDRQVLVLTSTPEAPQTATAQPTATPVPPTPTPLVQAVQAAGAGANYDLCPPRTVFITSQEKNDALDYWNFSAEIWNAVVQSETNLDTAIPQPLTYENARASAAFRDALNTHLALLNAQINVLVNRRALGVPDRVHAMSLREGDYYDYQRVLIQRMLGGMNGDIGVWNSAVDLAQRSDEYGRAAEAEIRVVCAYLGGI